MKRTGDVTILGTVVYGVAISTTTFTLRSRTSLASTQMNNQSKASTIVGDEKNVQRVSPTRVCKKLQTVNKQLKRSLHTSVT